MTTQLGPPRAGVALIPGWRDDAGQAPDHLERLDRSVLIEGRIIARSALHIGVGADVDSFAPSDRPVLRDRLGRPIIPGSTLKGTVRATVEALLLGAGLAGGIDACDPVERPCLDARGRAHLVRSLGEDRVAIAREVLGRSCATCHLFGSPWMRGRARFADLEPLGSARTAVRVCRPVSRDRQTAALTWTQDDFEVAPPGSTFGFAITVSNPRPWEVGLIVACLRQLDEGYLTLGGLAGRGLGRVRVVIEGARDADALDLLLGRPGEVAGMPSFRARFGAAPDAADDELDAEAPSDPGDDGAPASDPGDDATDSDPDAGDAPGDDGDGGDGEDPVPGGSIMASPAPADPADDEPAALHPAYVALREAVVEATRRVGEGQPNHSVIPQFMAAAGWTRARLIEEGFLTEQRKDWKIFYKKALEAGAVWGDEQTLLVETQSLGEGGELLEGGDAGEPDESDEEAAAAAAARARPFGDTPDDVRVRLERWREALETFIESRRRGDPLA